jgi:hypothetical protein
MSHNPPRAPHRPIPGDHRRGCRVQWRDDDLTYTHIARGVSYGKPTVFRESDPRSWLRSHGAGGDQGDPRDTGVRI